MTVMIKNIFPLFLIYSKCFSLKSSFIHMKKGENKMKSLSKFYKPKSKNQEVYFNFLNDVKTKIIFAVGPAGTGKTLLACNNAIKELSNGTYEKIIITRPVVPVEEDIGFLPGNMIKKMDPWTRPIFDVFLEFYGQKEIDLMIQNNIIEISPLAYMRGRTFKKAFIIADEMQNSSPNQMLMLTTRIGLGSKMVITGDLNQTDRETESGLADFIRKFKLYQKNVEEVDRIKLIELANEDIEREPIITKILDIYNMQKNKVLDKIPSIENKNKNELRSLDENDDAALIPKRHMMKKLK